MGFTNEEEKYSRKVTKKVKKITHEEVTKGAAAIAVGSCP